MHLRKEHIVGNKTGGGHPGEQRGHLAYPQVNPRGYQRRDIPRGAPKGKSNEGTHFFSFKGRGYHSWGRYKVLPRRAPQGAYQRANRGVTPGEPRGSTHIRGRTLASPPHNHFFLHPFLFIFFFFSGGHLRGRANRGAPQGQILVISAYLGGNPKRRTRGGTKWEGHFGGRCDPLPSFFFLREHLKANRGRYPREASQEGIQGGGGDPKGHLRFVLKPIIPSFV